MAEVSFWDLAKDLLTLRGKPLDLDPYPYLRQIYETRAREVGLFTARQVAKCEWVEDRVMLPNGESKRLGDVVVGDVLLSTDGAMKAVPRAVLAVADTGTKPCRRIVFQSGTAVTVTAEHRLRTLYGYTAAADLVVGSRVASASSGGTFEGRAQPRDRIIGTAYMIGDGCCRRSNWDFTSACAEALREMSNLQGASEPHAKKGLASRVRFSRSSPLVQWLCADGMADKYSYDKWVPPWVFELSFADTGLFMSRLWATDGTINTHDSCVNVEYATSSYRLALDVQNLLRKLGARSTITRRETFCNGKQHRDGYKVRLLGMDGIRRFYLAVGHIPGKPFIDLEVASNNNRLTTPLELNAAIRRLAAPVIRAHLKDSLFDADLRLKPQYPLTAGKLQRYVEFFDKMGCAGPDMELLRCVHGADVWWDRVKAIEPAGELPTRDIQIEGTENYVIEGGIVSHNSTFLASKLVLRAVTEANSSQVYISPLQDQAEVFSMQRLRDFLDDSPIIKHNFFSGPKTVNQVFKKVLSNGSIISCGYAMRCADRLRGRSGVPVFDECQDIIPEVIPVIKEIAFRVMNPTYWFCGTPKGLSNHMEAMRLRSTACEWAVRCPATGCKKWNLEWDERNIGRTGVICRHCGDLLNTDPGQWVSARKMDTEKGIDARVNMESYRIPQLIVRPIMSDPYKWTDLLAKISGYSSAQLANEVLGLPYDSGSQPVTEAQLAACCHPTRPNVLPAQDGTLPPLFMGVDWAFVGEDSFTVLVIGGWDSFPSKFRVYYYRIFRGAETDSRFQIATIVQNYRAAGVQLIGADWGAGHVQNIDLQNTLGVDRVMQLWHTGLNGGGAGAARAARMKWDPRVGKWHLARTRVLTDTFEAVRKQQIEFPRFEDCRDMFDHFLSMSLEYNERTNLQHYTHLKPDDCVHAVTFAMLAGEFYLRGDFQGNQNSVMTTGAQEQAVINDPWAMEAGVEDLLYQ